MTDLGTLNMLRPESVTLTVALQNTSLVLGTTHAFLGGRGASNGALEPIPGIAGTYGGEGLIPRLTINQYGQVTRVELIAFDPGSGGTPPGQIAYLLLEDGDYLVTDSGAPITLE